MKYQDYVIKDGRFVGKFEEMYRDFDDPWHQIEEAGISYSKHDTIHTVRRFGLKKIIEVGCGLGYFTKKLSDCCEGAEFMGLDISETAIAKAKAMFPTLKFTVGGVSKLDKIFELADYDGIIFSEILWYILDDLDNVLSMIRKKFHGMLIVNQVFYHGVQKYGREYFTNPDELIKYFAMTPIVKNVSDDADHETSYESHIVFKI